MVSILLWKPSVTAWLPVKRQAAVILSGKEYRV